MSSVTLRLLTRLGHALVRHDAPWLQHVGFRVAYRALNAELGRAVPRSLLPGTLDAHVHVLHHGASPELVRSAADHLVLLLENASYENRRAHQERAFPAAPPRPWPGGARPAPRPRLLLGTRLGGATLGRLFELTCERLDGPHQLPRALLEHPALPVAHLDQVLSQALSFGAPPAEAGPAPTGPGAPGGPAPRVSAVETSQWARAHARLADNPALSAPHRARLLQSPHTTVRTAVLARVDSSRDEAWAEVRRCLGAVAAHRRRSSPAAPFEGPQANDEQLLHVLAARLARTPRDARRLGVRLLPILHPTYRSALLSPLIELAAAPGDVEMLARGLLRLWRAEAAAGPGRVGPPGPPGSGLPGTLWLSVARRLASGDRGGPGTRLGTAWLELGLVIDPRAVAAWLDTDWPAEAWAGPDGRRAAALVLARGPRDLRQRLLARLGARAPGSPAPEVAAQRSAVAVVASRPHPSGP